MAEKSKPRVRLYADSRPTQWFLEAFFPDEVEAGRLRVQHGEGQGDPISMAMTTLLERPGSLVAVVINTDTTDEDRIERELRGPAFRTLAGAAYKGWHVALAIPRIDAWAVHDPRVKADFESRPETRSDDAFWARGLRITELAKAAPIDVDRIARADEEFRGLLEFSRQHTRA
jgi:hypothetical protein